MQLCLPIANSSSEPDQRPPFYRRRDKTSHLMIFCRISGWICLIAGILAQITRQLKPSSLSNSIFCRLPAATMGFSLYFPMRHGHSNVQLWEFAAEIGQFSPRKHRSAHPFKIAIPGACVPICRYFYVDHAAARLRQMPAFWPTIPVSSA